MSQHTIPAPEKTVDVLVAFAKDDPDKARVFTYIAELVADGFAAWEIPDDGEIEVRLASGERYLLKETGILRVP